MSLRVSYTVHELLGRRSNHLISLHRYICTTNSASNEAAQLKANNTPLKNAGPNEALPPLNRPLGVRERPTTLRKTRTQRIKDLMDDDILLAERRHLIKEASKGYFHDMNMTRKHGGKTWVAPKVLIREDKSLYMPNITGTSLDNKTKKNTTEMCYGRISIVSMLGTQVSELHAKSFVDHAHSRFRSNPLYQYIQINIQENLLKSFLVNLFTKKLKAMVPADLQPTYLVSSQNMEYVRDPLGMTNSKVGYVYLVDENLKVRWGGCADATAEEAYALESCVGVLLKRLEKNPKKGRIQTLDTTIPPSP